jgi:oxygen-independent coproporphyrinogen-3 oxidase
MKTISLYIHIPFCKKKCLYCDFVSFENSQKNIEPYFSALYKEIKAYKTILYEEYSIDTIFIGGGTPNFVDVKYIEELMSILFDTFEINENAEISMEINPCGHISKDDFKRYKKSGINRLSIGLQSASDDMLKQIGRQHSLLDFENAFQAAREADFANINIDLIFGFYNQNVDEFRDTVRYVIDTGCEHVSCYSLKLEEETPLYEMYLNEGIDIEDEDYEDRQMYRLACQMLEYNGYKQYELSNYAKFGYECRHNLNYWDTKEYIGFGLAAHSYKDYARFYNTSDMNEYLQNIDMNSSAIEEIEQIDKTKQEEEFIIMALRKTIGVEYDEFKRRFGEEFLIKYNQEVNYLTESGLLIAGSESAYLSDEGKNYANITMMEFISK